MKDAIKNSFERLIRESKIVLRTSTTAVLVYTEERTAHLQAHASEPGFGEMVAAELRNVAQFAGIEAAQLGDSRDAALRGQVFGFLLALLAAA